MKQIFLLLKTYFVVTQKKRLNETVLLSTQNTCLKMEGKKILTISRSHILFILTYGVGKSNFLFFALSLCYTVIYMF